MRILCLVPVRNGQEDLPGFLESAAGFADGVIALDDGSTDATAELLEASPLIERVLSNPVRPTYAGWDDRANRQRLLEAAAEAGADWIVYLDADERLDPEDAAALRAFLERDALGSFAYGFLSYRMWGERYDPEARWVYRAFVPRRGLELPEGTLHFNPVPVSLDRRRWVRTTIRVRHLGSADERRRLDRLAKYADADPDQRWPTSYGGLDAVPDRDLPEWAVREPSLAVLYDPAADHGPPPREAGPGDAGGPPLVVLLPVRNGEAILPAWFDSVRSLAEAVVALDDGSTDATRDLLEAEPLVRIVLSNPRREGYAGWDDAGNRQRVLDAAGELHPRWVLWLDADERIDPGDARALREFVDREAVPGFAYGFRLFRMLEPGDVYDRAGVWVYRLFAHQPGQRLPQARLHEIPVPEDIPRTRWRRTTVRIQHHAGLTHEARLARYAKYRESDPDNLFQAGYENLLAVPGPRRPWEPREAGTPVLAGPVGETPVDEADMARPVLSAIVIARDDRDTIARAVGSVVAQEVPERFEVIVVVSGSPETARIVRDRFPDVTLLELERPALPGAARNAGVRTARGDYVSFPGSHVELPPGSLAARIRAHELGYPMVTGTILNGTHTRAGWASYFLDHSSALPGRPSEILNGPPAHCSYTREFLQQAGSFPEDMRAGEDTVANFAMVRLGYRAYRAQDVRLVHHTRCRTIPRLLRHHFVRGRAMGRILLEGTGPAAGASDRREAARRFLQGYVRRRVEQTTSNVERWGGDLTPTYRRVLSLVKAGAAAAWAGAWFEIAARRVS